VTSATQHLRPLVRDERFRQWGPGIHVATGSARFLGLPLWNTACVLELERPGHLLVWNPISLTDSLRHSLRDLEQSTGRRVTMILNGLDYHHRELSTWQRAFPEAETFLVSERIRDQQPGVEGQVIDGDRPIVPGCEGDIELLSVRGCLPPRLERSPRWKNGPRREWFVYHRQSRSLLVGDMLHLHQRVSTPQRLLLGLRVGFALNRAGFRLADATARAGFARDVLSWPIEQALTVHGTASAHGADFIQRELRFVLGV